MIYSVSKLESDHVQAIEQLERETGRTLIAFSPLAVESDSVGDSDLEKIRELERRIGVMLVAVCH